MDRINIYVNGDKYTVGGEVTSDVSLNDYLREHLELRGTKYMCKEGGCGACIVTARVPAIAEEPARTISVNSCLVSVTSCHNWEVTTVEGLGDRRKGYHPLQKTLAEYNGTQCGYCSPGWVMSMHGLLESNAYKLTQYEIENSFGSNTCRCTGYRPILEAFKSFAEDAPKPNLIDIEDLKVCKNKNKSNCQETCADAEWCKVDKSDVVGYKKIHLKDERVWYRVTELKQVFQIFHDEGLDSYMLVNGNTGKGATPIFSYPRVLIDVSPVAELRAYYLDQNLVVGAGTTLTAFMELCRATAARREEFQYLDKFYEHLDLVAHIPVRNIGSLAGNLMTKYRTPTFSSDVFLLFNSVGAIFTIVDKNSTVQVSPEEFLALDMTGKIITQIKLPPLSHRYLYVTFKIMPRAQNAHASVNAAFLYETDGPTAIVASARLAYGGLSGAFHRAKLTEHALKGCPLFAEETLQSALDVLQGELPLEKIAGELKPEYRKKCALGLFYKGLLTLVPKTKLNPIYRSGARDFRKTRPVSKGIQVYDTNPVIWPINEPEPKIDALIQCAGEAKYVNDIPSQPREVFCAFVTSDICIGEIESIDASPALKLPGVVAFFSTEDIPGLNSFMSNKIQAFPIPEEVFVDNRQVRYYDQAIGVIVAETEILANRAALLVRIKYKVDRKKPVLTIEEGRKDPSRVSLFVLVPARERGLNVQRVIKGSDRVEMQYAFSMETLSSVTMPNDDGLDAHIATQWMDAVQLAIADVLKIDCGRVNLIAPRCGGAYGVKLTRASHTAAACALVTHLTNRPCRFVMTIQSNMRVIGRRPSATRDFEVGINNRGEIQYLVYNLYEDQGYVASEPLLLFGVAAVKNCYNSSRWMYQLFDVTTDQPANTYLRAPGALECIAFTEMIMEQISYELNLDPLEVRLANLDPKYPDVAEVIQTIIRDSEYYKRKADVERYNKINRWKKRGLRVAAMSWPLSLLLEENVLMTVYHGDGSVVIKHGGVEMGQGTSSRITKAVAYTLNISMDKIKVKPSDAISSPNSFGDGGSGTTMGVVIGAIKCCQLILDRLSVVRESLNDPTWDTLVQVAHQRGINLQTSYHSTTNDRSTDRIAGAVVVEVELDILTGEHEILRVDLIEDVGLSLNPQLDIGQIEGAFTMGIGYWTHEHFIVDKKTGELLTDRTWTYHVPIAKDIPLDFRVQLRRNSYNPIGALGSKAVAEPPTTLAVAVAFALRAAIVASRDDSGYPTEKWFNVDGPFTLEANVLKSDVPLKEFKLYKEREEEY